jgi:AMMECR1 domain-containing protein
MLRRGWTDAERRAVERTVGELLRFQRTLRGWKNPGRAPDATPFVSLYAGGRLRGCYGSHEGLPGERIARAFLRAANDGRFGGVGGGGGEPVVAQVSYVRRAVLANPETGADELELGVHGVAVVRPGGRGTLLLPEVARDERASGRDLVRRLAIKAGLAEEGLGGHAVYRFETERVVVRPGAVPRRVDPAAAALDWLTGLVGRDGRVTFAVDPRTGQATSTGAMHHARASVVAHALGAHGVTSAHAAAADRARRRLLADARAALAGSPVEAWPSDPAQVAGTLALLLRGGVPVRDDLLAFVRTTDVARSPWHASQVVAVLGRDAPEPLWSAALADLDVHPWAPWTLLAADARGDLAVRDRVARSLAAGIRDHAPHAGAGALTEVPEVPLTALAVEALVRHPAPWARAAARRARAFVARAQLVGARLYGALDPAVATGAFPASLAADSLRCDATAHAVLALGPLSLGRGRAATWTRR